MPIYIYLFNILFFIFLIVLIFSPLLINWMIYHFGKTEKYKSNKITFFSFCLTVLFFILFVFNAVINGNAYTKKKKMETYSPVTQVLFFNKDDTAKVIIDDQKTYNISLNDIGNITLIKDAEKHPDKYVLDKYLSKRLGIYYPRFYLREK